MRAHHISFKHALDGVWTAVKTQPNFRIHLTLSLLSVTLGIVVQISRLEWIAIAIVIAMGLAIELLNTAIEFTVDLVTSEYHVLAKYAKDTAAAAMLMYAICAVAIACFIFIPRLWPFT